MITPEEISLTVFKWWEPLLRSSLLGNNNFFPKRIDRIGKIKAQDLTQRFDEIKIEVEELYKYSKNQKGIGYTVKTAERSFRRKGDQEIPDTIEIETLEDFLHIIGKEKEWRLFQKNLRTILDELPQLKDWVVNSPLPLTRHDIYWPNILKVCQYFIHTPRPMLYLRELPIAVHTKFIEDNNVLLRSLLDFLIPQDIRNSKERKNFAERYYLNHDEPQIRIRLLDEKLTMANISDIAIRLSDFERMNIDCKTVFITENKMNFLTLPQFPSAIAIWSGGGFMVSYFQNVQWLETKTLYYWGDIDEHGFQILHQIRSYYKNVQSLMMDIETYLEFEHFSGEGKRNNSSDLSLLTKEEASLYALLKQKNGKNRLEQEKVSQFYVNSQLQKRIPLVT